MVEVEGGGSLLISSEDCGQLARLRGGLYDVQRLPSPNERAKREEGEKTKRQRSQWEMERKERPPLRAACCAAAISRFRTARAMGEASLSYITSASTNTSAGCG